MVSNPINELSDDDEDYIFSYDSSITDDDNKYYDENVDNGFFIWKAKELLHIHGDVILWYDKWWL